MSDIDLICLKMRGAQGVARAGRIRRGPFRCAGLPQEWKKRCPPGCGRGFPAGTGRRSRPRRRRSRHRCRWPSPATSIRSCGPPETETPKTARGRSCHDGVITAVSTEPQQTAEQRHADQLRAEDTGQGLEETLRDGVFFLQALEAVRLLDIAAHPDNQQRRQQADQKHHPPGNVLRHERIDQGEHTHRQPPAHRPRALHGAHDLAAVLGIDGFGHQHRPCGPLPANAETLQRLDDQQRAEAGHERRKEGEKREPQDHPLQRAHPAVAVRQRAADPAAQGRSDQRHATDQPGVAFAQGERGDKRRNGQAEHLHFEGVERPTAEAGPERLAFTRSDLAIPIEHAFCPYECEAAGVQSPFLMTGLSADVGEQGPLLSGCPRCNGSGWHAHASGAIPATDSDQANDRRLQRQAQGMGNRRRRADRFDGEDAALWHLALAGDALKTKKPEQRRLKLRPPDEGAPALLALQNVFTDQHVHGFAHRTGRQAILARQRRFGRNGFARPPSIVGDLFGELVTQTLIERQADITGESVHGGGVRRDLRTNGEWEACVGGRQTKTADFNLPFAGVWRAWGCSDGRDGGQRTDHQGQGEKSEQKDGELGHEISYAKRAVQSEASRCDTLRS
nr:hypothetical protein [Tanacetum cinerariifolium]